MISCYNVFCVFNKEEECDNEDAPIIDEKGNCVFCVMTEVPESVLNRCKKFLLEKFRKFNEKK